MDEDGGGGAAERLALPSHSFSQLDSVALLLYSASVVVLPSSVSVLLGLPAPISGALATDSPLLSSVRTWSSVRTPVQFGPPRSQLLLRLLLKLVSESNCLENRSRILVILLFINLAADL